MLKVDASKLIAQLQKLEKEITGKLEVMVRGFAYDITEEAIDNTPYNFDGINWMYNLTSRRKILGNPEVGKAKGGWTLGINKIVAIRNPEAASDAGASNTKSVAAFELTNYKLGNTIYLTNKTPHVVKDGFPLDVYPGSGKPVLSLENGGSPQAPNGIMRPTMQTIQTVYSLQLGDYYKKGTT